LIHCIWKEMKTLWMLRNEDRHGKDEETRLARRYHHTRRETEWLYSMKDHCLPEHREELFYSSLQEHLHMEQSEKQMRDWISLSKRAIISSVNQSHEQSTARAPVRGVRRQQQVQQQSTGRSRRTRIPQTWREDTVTDNPTAQTPEEDQQMRITMQQWLQPTSIVQANHPRHQQVPIVEHQSGTAYRTNQSDSESEASNPDSILEMSKDSHSSDRREFGGQDEDSSGEESQSSDSDSTDGSSNGSAPKVKMKRRT
jgi:hypothetical protein